MTFDVFCGRETDKTPSQPSVCITIHTSQQQRDDRPPLAYTSEVRLFLFFIESGVCAKHYFFGEGAQAQSDCFRRIAISRQGLGAVTLEMKHC